MRYTFLSKRRCLRRFLDIGALPQTPRFSRPDHSNCTGKTSPLSPFQPSKAVSATLFSTGGAAPVPPGFSSMGPPRSKSQQKKSSDFRDWKGDKEPWSYPRLFERGDPHGRKSVLHAVSEANTNKKPPEASSYQSGGHDSRRVVGLSSRLYPYRAADVRHALPA